MLKYIIHKYYTYTHTQETNRISLLQSTVP